MLKFFLISIRPHNPPIDKLNAAQSRGKVEDLSQQVDYLVTQGRKEEGIDFDKDWKILNILIGGNNLFDCHLPESHPDVFEKRMNETLSKIYEKIPRVFVNLFNIFEDGLMDTWNNGKDVTYCSRFWKVISFAIPCMVKSDELRQKMVQYSKEYNVRMSNLAKWWNNKREKKDFFIAVQPVLQHTRLPDLSYSSKFDCFHPSLKSNAELSITIWNSLQLPWDKKPRSSMKEFLCPNENTIVQ